jgi:LysR family glycine cleavage system transcriptional activator
LPAAIVAPDLAKGRLVRLAEIRWPEEFAYYLVHPQAFHERPKVAAFRSWIIGAAAAVAG